MKKGVIVLGGLVSFRLFADSDPASCPLSVTAAITTTSGTNCFVGPTIAHFVCRLQLRWRKEKEEEGRESNANRVRT